MGEGSEVSTFEDEMAGFDEEWAENQANAGQFRMLDDGTYQAVVVESRVEKSDWDEWQFNLKFADKGGKGTVRVWDSLENEVGRSVAAEHAAALGYSGPLSGLKTACEQGEFIDLLCDIRVRTKTGETRDFKQVFINRTYGKADPGEIPGQETMDAPPDDDIPF
jgi:hypothetical protein